jgi:hypothetical protein
VRNYRINRTSNTIVSTVFSIAFLPAAFAAPPLECRLINDRRYATPNCTASAAKIPTGPPDVPPVGPDSGCGPGSGPDVVMPLLATPLLARAFGAVVREPKFTPVANPHKLKFEYEIPEVRRLIYNDFSDETSQTVSVLVVRANWLLPLKWHTPISDSSVQHREVFPYSTTASLPRKVTRILDAPFSNENHWSLIIQQKGITNATGAAWVQNTAVCRLPAPIYGGLTANPKKQN